MCEANAYQQVYAGIDPGSEGAIGFLAGKSSCVVDIPVSKIKRGAGKKSKNKTVYDLDRILCLFDCLAPLKRSVRFLIEEPPPNMTPGQGSPYGQFRLGGAFAMWPLFLRSKGYNVETVYPSVWKRKMGISSDKERSLRTARKLFPFAPLSRKKDHNRSEALLLAVYCRRLFGG